MTTNSSQKRAPRFWAGALVVFLAQLSLLACTPPSYWATHAGQKVVLANDVYAEELVLKAKKERFAFSNAWLRLGHYRRDPLGGPYQSEADGTAFFLSPTGKLDPQAELEATIRAVLAKTNATDDKSLDEHPACRFPARVFVLSQGIGLDLQRLGAPRCPGFQKFLAELKPSGASLIFTSYYLNNPASAFGHTFLRIHKANRFAVGKKRELLDYGVDFSANVTTSNPILYAFMGLFGMFEGTFKRVPYYYKVREYNDVESRDLWSYELDLSPEQLLVLSGHIWEVGHTYFDYYYLAENCSYHVLGLVEAARPDLTLASGMNSPIVPSATVQALFQHPGFVRNVKYRPALRSQFNARVSDLSGDELDLLDQLANDADAPLPTNLPPERAIAVLDAAADLIDVRFAKDMLFEREGEGATRKQKLLERRASYQLPSPDVAVPAESQKAPEKGHLPGRFGLSLGRDAGANTFIGTDFRLALHDLADPADGFPDLAQIEFLPVRVRFGLVNEKFRVRLDDAQLVRVLSLTSFERFDRHVSFKVSAGARGIDGGLCSRCTAGQFVIGGGVAKAFFEDRFLLFAMSDAELLVGPRFRDGSDIPLQVGVGPSGGMRLRLHPSLVFFGRGYWYYMPYQDPGSRYQVDATLRWGIGKNFAVSAEGRAIRQGLEGQGFLLGYF